MSGIKYISISGLSKKLSISKIKLDEKYCVPKLHTLSIYF